MEVLLEGFKQAFLLLIHGDPQVLKIVGLSLVVSGLATIISLALGIPFGSILGLTRFPGRRILISLVNTGMGAPPVVVGLVVFIFLWRTGPLGILHILYTPQAMLIAQIIISLPIVAGFTMATIQQLDPKLRLQILALGASWPQMVWLLLREARLPLLRCSYGGFWCGYLGGWCFPDGRRRYYQSYSNYDNRDYERGKRRSFLACHRFKRYPDDIDLFG